MKTDGIASAASALRYWERRQEVASNNLANATTTAFKGERVFARLVGDALPVPDAATDFREGALSPTGNPLDMAIHGDGFFVVNTALGERWSRGGSFSIDPKGFLVDADGNQLLGEKGAIQVATIRPDTTLTDAATTGAGDREASRTLGADVTIDATGLVIVDGIKLDRLRMETMAPGTRLVHEAGTHFVPDASRQVVALGARDVQQGQLEASNVNTISTLVDLISIQRNFANAQKVLSTLDGIHSTIVNDLAKVG